MTHSKFATTILLLICGLLPGCSNDESAPPPPAGCGPLADNVACERASGECVPLQCVGLSWACAPEEIVVARAPGRCMLDDAGADDAGADDAGADAGAAD
jgi:hypothetical protein